MLAFTSYSVHFFRMLRENNGDTMFMETFIGMFMLKNVSYLTRFLFICIYKYSFQFRFCTELRIDSQSKAPFPLKRIFATNCFEIHWNSIFNILFAEMIDYARSFVLRRDNREHLQIAYLTTATMHPRYNTENNNWNNRAMIVIIMLHRCDYHTLEIHIEITHDNNDFANLCGTTANNKRIYTVPTNLLCII